MTEVSRPARSATVTIPSDREIQFERVFDAPRERVWRAYTDPELVARWWGGDSHVVVERMEVERGGHWRFIAGADGFEGRYREVTPTERLIETFDWDGKPGHVQVDSLTFEDLGDGRTKLVSRSLFHTVEDRDFMISSGMEEGNNEGYRALDRLLATMS